MFDFVVTNTTLNISIRQTSSQKVTSVIWLQLMCIRATWSQIIIFIYTLFLTYGFMNSSDDGWWTVPGLLNPSENWSHCCFLSTVPPTNVQLALPAKVTEGRSVTITCTAESFPPSHIQIQFTSLTSHTFSYFSSQPAKEKNTLSHTFNATSAHTGSYGCSASNSEGTNRSDEKKLKVECEWSGNKAFFNINLKLELSILCQCASVKKKKKVDFKTKSLQAFIFILKNQVVQISKRNVQKVLMASLLH